MNPTGMFDHLRSGLQQGAKGLSGELQLPLEIGMFVHEGQQIVVQLGELPPNGRPHVAVVVHVPVQDITHIHRFLVLLGCRSMRRMGLVPSTGAQEGNPQP